MMHKTTACLIVTALMAVTAFTGCNELQTVSVKADVDWSMLRKSLAYASVTKNAWHAPEKLALPQANLNINDPMPPLGIVDELTGGQGTIKEMSSLYEKIDGIKEQACNSMLMTLESWDMDKTALRAENIANILHIRQPFSQILIQPDPVLPSGLSRTIIEGTTARIIIPAGIPQRDFDNAFVNALIMWDMKSRMPDMKIVEHFCKVNNTFLPANEQFASDMAFAMSTWLEGTVEPDYRTYLLKSSLDFGHVFTLQVSQWAGNYFQFLGNTNLTEVIANAVRDCENPLYQKVYTSLKNHGVWKVKLEDTKEGVRIAGFGSQKTRESGLLEGDVIVSFDKVPVKASWNIASLLYDKDRNESTFVKIIRPKGKGSEKSVGTHEQSGDNLILAYDIELE